MLYLKRFLGRVWASMDVDVVARWGDHMFWVVVIG